MKVYSLLTGRGNNTLKDKNILDIMGYPVLHYPAVAVANSKFVSEKFCSSDDDKILEAAENDGYKPIKRPEELARPDAQHIECIKHALQQIGGIYDTPDILVVSLANNVTIKTEWVDDCIKKMIDDMSISAVVPVYEDNDHHPFRAKKVNADGTLIAFEENMPREISTNRQDLSKCYFLAHNFWVLNVKKMLDDVKGEPPWSFMGDKVIPYEIEESLDIHDSLDLILAQEWIKSNLRGD